MHAIKRGGKGVVLSVMCFLDIGLYKGTRLLLFQGSVFNTSYRHINYSTQTYIVVGMLVTCLAF